MELSDIAEAYKAALEDKMLFEQRTWHVYYWLEMQINGEKYKEHVKSGEHHIAGIAMNVVRRYQKSLGETVRVIKETHVYEPQKKNGIAVKVGGAEES